LRSPIGVLMVIFQFPSTAISVSSHIVRKTGMVLSSGCALPGGIAHLMAQAQSSCF
jgi:hypothetical protein